jgi:hypothetical protein
VKQRRIVESYPTFGRKILCPENGGNRLFGKPGNCYNIKNQKCTKKMHYIKTQNSFWVTFREYISAFV